MYVFVSGGNILFRQTAAPSWPWISVFVVATKSETLRVMAHIPSKDPKRVSWNAAYIAVSPTRVCVLMVFSSGLRLNSGGWCRDASALRTNRAGCWLLWCRYFGTSYPRNQIVICFPEHQSSR